MVEGSLLTGCEGVVGQQCLCEGPWIRILGEIPHFKATRNLGLTPVRKLQRQLASLASRS